MATQSLTNVQTFPASTDLSSYQFHAMTLDTNGRVKVADDADQAGEPIIGILLNKPTAISQECEIAGPGSRVKAITDESINEGSWLTCSEDGTDKGQVIATTTTGDQLVGYSITAVGDAELVELIVVLGVY